MFAIIFHYIDKILISYKGHELINWEIAINRLSISTFFFMEKLIARIKASVIIKKYCQKVYNKIEIYLIKKKDSLHKKKNGTFRTITCNNTRWIVHVHSCESLDKTNRQAEFASVHTVLRSCTSKESWLILLSNGDRVIGRIYSLNLRPDASSRRAPLSSGISMTSMTRDDRLNFIVASPSNIWHCDSFWDVKYWLSQFQVEHDYLIP